MAGRFHMDVGMIFSHAQSSAPVSVTVHPAEGAPFTVHCSPFTVQSNPAAEGLSESISRGAWQKYP
eukprot:365215-Chlamydomonas_euryale.AAC.4